MILVQFLADITNTNIIGGTMVKWVRFLAPTALLDSRDNALKSREDGIFHHGDFITQLTVDTLSASIQSLSKRDFLKPSVPHHRVKVSNCGIMTTIWSTQPQERHYNKCPWHGPYGLKINIQCMATVIDSCS